MNSIFIKHEALIEFVNVYLLTYFGLLQRLCQSVHKKDIAFVAIRKLTLSACIIAEGVEKYLAFIWLLSTYYMPDCVLRMRERERERLKIRFSLSRNSS